MTLFLICLCLLSLGVFMRGVAAVIELFRPRK
jgi:hypothetical protein